MSIWTPAQLVVPEFKPTEEMICEEADKHSSVMNNLPYQHNLKVAHTNGYLSVIKKPNVFSPLESDEEKAERERWMVSVPVIKGDPDGTMDALEAKLEEVAGEDYLYELMGQALQRRVNSKRSSWITSQKWEGPDYQPGRTKKEWGQCARAARDQAVKDGAIPNGAIKKFTYTKAYSYEIGINVWLSMATVGDPDTRRDMDAADQIMGTLYDYMLRYACGHWSDTDDGPQMVQWAVSFGDSSDFDDVKWVDDRSDEVKAAEIAEAMADDIKHSRERAIESGIDPDVAQGVTERSYSDPDQIFPKLKGHSRAGRRWDDMCREWEHVDHDRAYAAAKLYIEQGDGSALIEYGNQVGDERRERVDAEYKAKEEKRKAEQRQKVQENAAHYLDRIHAVVDGLLAKFPRADKLNAPTPAGKVMRIERDTGRIVYADSVSFGNNYRRVQFSYSKGEVVTLCRDPEPVVADMEALLADPVAAAKGVNKCIFCFRELTDATSRKHGYGPDCASSNDMDWVA